MIVIERDDGSVLYIRKDEVFKIVQKDESKTFRVHTYENMINPNNDPFVTVTFRCNVSSHHFRIYNITAKKLDDKLMNGDDQRLKLSWKRV